MPTTTRCPECKYRPLSRSARKCPRCGAKLGNPWKRCQAIGAVAAIVAAPLLPISPPLALLVAVPGLALFVAGRIGAAAG